VNQIVVSLPIGLVENQLAELTRFSNLNIAY
jgi:hypothetical protein